MEELKEGRVYSGSRLGLQPIMVGKGWLQDLEAAGHDECETGSRKHEHSLLRTSSAFSLRSRTSALHTTGASDILGWSSHLIKPIQKVPHRHAWSFVSMAILNFTKKIGEINLPMVDGTVNSLHCMFSRSIITVSYRAVLPSRKVCVCTRSGSSLKDYKRIHFALRAPS